MRAKVSDWRGLCLRTSAKWADFVAQSLHWKLPFPTQVRDWFDDWVVGSQFDIYCLHHPVLPKPQIPAPPLNRPFLWGFSLVSFRSFRLWRHFAVSQPGFSLASLHPKIPFPASGFSTARSPPTVRRQTGSCRSTIKTRKAARHRTSRCRCAPCFKAESLHTQRQRALMT